MGGGQASRSIKRSFMARFLEDDDDDPGPDSSTKHRWRRVGGQGKRRRGVLERVFGICEADPKEGREASSVIHPQSPFATGARRATLVESAGGPAIQATRLDSVVLAL